MTDGSPTATFRDPAGSLTLEADRVVRTVYPDSRAAVLEFLDSAFCQRLQERGDLVAASVVEHGGPPGTLTLLHPRIAISTYPWEWTLSQWLAAAALTLRLCEEALEFGWILKDATPLNILFVGSHPVLVDILSFERLLPGGSIWLAYGQYVRTFLLPLVMRRLMGWPLVLTMHARDGYEPARLYGELGWTQRLSRAALWPITLPALLERRDPEAGATGLATKKQDPGLAMHVLRGSLATLGRQTRRAAGGQASSDWSRYTATLTHYSEAERAAKRAWVATRLTELAPARVLDVGANTGEFSRLAAEGGAEVVALERDEAAADRIAGMAAELGLPVLAVHADLARPTPAMGWGNAEQSSLLSRLRGQFDLVMLLAVVHHLLVMEQIPLPAIMGLCHRLTRRWLVLEWVPPADPMYRSLMRGRDALYGSLGEDDLGRACEGLFTTIRREALANGRVLFLFEKAESSGQQTDARQ